MSAQQARKRESRPGGPQMGEPQEGQAIEFEKWAEAMRGEFDHFLHQTWKEMNAARKGRWIADTEEVMLEARDRLGRRAYEKLLQLRIEAGEGAFSPSRPGPGLEEQRPQASNAPDRDGTS